MASRYPIFDRSTLTLAPLAGRRHDLNLASLLPLAPVERRFTEMTTFAGHIKSARAAGCSSLMLIGGHVIRSGVQNYIIDLMRRGFITCIAMNGAGVIHDFELSLIGATTESVAHYIRTGEFGFWEETSRLNEIIARAAEEDLGLGEAVGKYILDSDLPYRESSILAQAYRLGIPVTVHVGVGYDIIHQHPNCDGAALGKASYRDFLIFAQQVASLSGGVVMNFGSAVMGPEIFLKALAMARNQARNNGATVTGFSTLVCDLKPLPDTYRTEIAKSDPLYYFRPWKTLLVRTCSISGQSYYVRGEHRQTIPALWTALTEGGQTS